MPVEFRLLGEVTAAVDGRPVELGHARQVAVLVALLVDANRPVPADQLLERAWGDRLPQRARNALSGYLSRLRQALADTDEVAIARTSTGYLLTVDPLAVDLHRFRRLLARARGGADPAAAADLFEQALGLWQGEPFATLDTPWLSGLRTALDAERRAADLDRTDLALAAGQHAGLLGDLTARAAEHPLDERLAGQLMLALYRSGRSADALDRYQRLRLLLVDELGADPGPPLQRLQQQILTADPALDGLPPPPRAGPAADPAPAPAAAPEPAPEPAARPAERTLVPRQLPAPPRAFTGRLPELAALDSTAAATGGQPTAVVISAVSGTAGVGKTTLAVHWAHRVAGRFPDGQLYVNLRGFGPSESLTNPAEAVRGFLDALAVPPERIPTSPDAQAGLYRSMLADRRMLVLLDNARDVDQVRPLLPGAPGCLVVVTSRNQLTGLVAAEGAQPINLDLLSAAEARDLLANRLGRARVAAEPDAVEEIVARCARLPLALSIVAARAAERPAFDLADLASQLREARGGLDALDGGDPATDTRAVFSWSYHALSPPAARLFRLLGLQQGPDFTVAAAASLAGLPAVQARRLLAVLARGHLITEHVPGRYTFHDLLRNYAAELTQAYDSDAARRTAQHRMLDHYLHTALAASRLTSPYREGSVEAAPAEPGVTVDELADHDQATGWYVAERRVLLAAVEHAARAGFERHAWQLAWAVADHLHKRGHWQDWTTAYRTGLHAAERLGDQRGQALAEFGLGSAATMLAHFADAAAHYQHALDRYTELGDHSGQARVHHNLCITYVHQADFGTALRHAEQSLELYRTAGNRIGENTALNAVGYCHAHLGNHERALPYCEQSLRQCQDDGDRLGAATTLDTLGYIYYCLDRYEQAASCYQQAHDVFREFGHRFQQAETLGNLADALAVTGDLGRARPLWQRALVILEELDHPAAGKLRAKLQEVAPAAGGQASG